MTGERRAMLPDLHGLPERLRRLRALGDISGRALSLLIGASQNTVLRLENEETQTPRGDVLVALARALGTSVEFIAEGVGDEPSAGAVRTALALAGYKPVPPKETP